MLCGAAQGHACTLGSAKAGRICGLDRVHSPVCASDGPRWAARPPETGGRRGAASHITGLLLPCAWQDPGHCSTGPCQNSAGASSHPWVRPASGARSRDRGRRLRPHAPPPRGMRVPLLTCCALLLLLTAPPHQLAAAAAAPLPGPSRLRVRWVPDSELDPAAAAVPGAAQVRAGLLLTSESLRERRRRALRQAAALPRRALLESSAQAQAALDELDRQAGALATSLLDAAHVGLAAAEGAPPGAHGQAAAAPRQSPGAGAPGGAPTLSGLVANSLDAANRRAPVIRMPDGYSIRPQARAHQESQFVSSSSGR